MYESSFFSSIKTASSVVLPLRDAVSTAAAVGVPQQDGLSKGIFRYKAVKTAWRVWGIGSPHGINKAASIYKAVILLSHITALPGETLLYAVLT